MVEVNKIMMTSFKRSSTLDPATGHHQPRPLPETPGHSQVSLDLLLGHCSFHLGSGAHKLLFVPSRSVSQSCISSGSSLVG